MTITELGNTSVLKLGETVGKDTDTPLFKTTLDGALSDIGDTAEKVITEEYTALCACADEQSDDETEVTDGEEEKTITSCLECDVNYKCEHYKNGGNDILADNGWTVTVSKKNGTNPVLNKTDEQSEKPLSLLDMMIASDLSNIHLPAELLKKRRSER